ncbi:hypothetical protein QUA96_23090, partial [Microcoleus sp. F6_B3]
MRVDSWQLTVVIKKLGLKPRPSRTALIFTIHSQISEDFLLPWYTAIVKVKLLCDRETGHE